MNMKKRLERAFGPNQVDNDVLEELAQHAAATYDGVRAEGGDAAEAERRVDAQIAAWGANPALLRRRTARAPAVIPPSGMASPAAALLQDTRYAWRLLRAQPAYA